MGLRRGIGLWMIVVVATLNLAACATMGDPPPTLYKRLGGREGIALVVGDFVTNMKAVFDTSFKARETSAMIDLKRIQEPLPAAAQAPTQP